jgi:hypothetical protein
MPLVYLQDYKRNAEGTYSVKDVQWNHLHLGWCEGERLGRVVWSYLEGLSGYLE